MQKLFCPSCGKANIYTLDRPEECRFCNSSLIISNQPSSASKSNHNNATTSIKNPKIAAREKYYRKYVLEEDVEEDDFEVSGANEDFPDELEFEIEGGEDRGIAFNDIMKNPDSIRVSANEISNSSNQKVDSKKFFQEQLKFAAQKERAAED